MELNETIQNQLKQLDQLHVIKYWNDLSDPERQILSDQLESIDFESLKKIIDQSKEQCSVKNNVSSISPITKSIIGCEDELSDESRKDLFDLGLSVISKGEVAFIVLAGGQGTRLDTIYPKGMFDLGLLSGKTLFQLQAERLLRIKQLASQHNIGQSLQIPWYIMTSEHTLKNTKDFLDKHNYFNYPREDVILFEQNQLPALHEDGKIVMVDRYKIGMSPDGNGGLFNVLVSSQILNDMRRRGIKYFHVCSVDNILVRVLDPTFIGFSIKNNADCSLKVIEKMKPEESLGVVCKDANGNFKVVEYSELSDELATQIDPEDKRKRLLYRHGNICNHFFTIDFLDVVTAEYVNMMKYHIAHKKMKCMDLNSNEIIVPPQPNVMKFEKFIFDVVPFSKDFFVWEVNKEKEFSPLKNSRLSPKESPITCMRDLTKLHYNWLCKTNSQVDINPEIFEIEDVNILEKELKKNAIEISSLVSYEGENLESLDSVRISACTTIDLIDDKVICIKH